MRGAERRCPPATTRRGLLPGAAAVVAAVLISDVVEHGPLTRAEEDLVWSRAPVAIPWAQVTRLGDRPALGAMAATASLASVMRERSRAQVISCVATVAVGTTVRWALSRAVRRRRPVSTGWLVDADGPSFPSRHATAATLGALVLCRALPPTRALRSALAAGVVAVGVSRVRLGVHWPSDVVAGIALATLADAVVSGIVRQEGSPVARQGSGECR
jgi:undecaprenyl-diphosphatase